MIWRPSWRGHRHAHTRYQEAEHDSFENWRYAARLRDRGGRPGHCHHHAGHRRPAAQIGKNVAAALVGTFLGILLCYGLSSLWRQTSTSPARRDAVFQVVKNAIVALPGDSARWCALSSPEGAFRTKPGGFSGNGSAREGKAVSDSEKFVIRKVINKK